MNENVVVMFHCWFCSRRANQCVVLIQGPHNICICEDCVAVSVTMVSQFLDKKLEDELAKKEKDANTGS